MKTEHFGSILVTMLLGVAILMPAAVQAELPMSNSPSWENVSYTIPTGAGWGDFNGDGYKDLVISFGLDEAAQPIAIFFGSDSGLGDVPGWVSSNQTAHGNLYVGDVDADGDPDLIASHLGLRTSGFPRGSHTLYVNNGGLPASPTWSSPLLNGFSCAMGDPDGDGDLDILFGNGVRSGVIPDSTKYEQTTLYVNVGGVFDTVAAWQTDSAYICVDAAFCDIDRDGDLDLALSGRMPLCVFYNNNGLLETTPSWQTSILPNGGRQIAFGDYDGDGWQDLAVAAIGAGFYILKNVNGVLDSIPVWSAQDFQEPCAVAWADVDADGDLDLTGGGWYYYAGVFENDNGVFPSDFTWEVPVYADYYSAEQFAWCDYDNDGLVDSTATFSGDGVAQVFTLGQKALQTIGAVTVGGVPLTLEEYCYDLVEGWVSLAAPPAAGATVQISYQYSIDLDLAVTTSERSCLIENKNVYDPERFNLLLLTDNKYGANFNIFDASNNIREWFEKWGFEVTLAAYTAYVPPCQFAAGVGCKTLRVDRIISDTLDLSRYDCVCILPGQAHDHLRQPEGLAFINRAADSGLVVAAWCRAVRVLAEADLINSLRVTGNADYQAIYEAAGATYVGNDHPPVIQGSVVTTVRSNFYRKENCEAIKTAMEFHRVGVWLNADTTLGWVPFEVPFEGWTNLDVDTWSWDFGDGTFSDEQSPTHLFETSGIYDISVEASVAAESRVWTSPELIIAVADTVKGGQVESDVYKKVQVDVNAHNTIGLSRIDIPLSYSGDFALTYDSFSTVGCRTEYFAEQTLVSFSDYAKVLTIRLMTDDQEELPPGEGTLVRLFFSTGAGSVGQETELDFTGYNDYHRLFLGSKGSYEPAFESGAVTYMNCCQGLRGNIDGDGYVEPTIMDVVYMVNYMFRNGPPPPCPQEANIDSDLIGWVTITDLVNLVSYMFESGPPPPACI